MLFRVNAQSEVYEAALSTLGVPYVLRGGERFFDRPEIREARLLLRGAARSGDADEALAESVRVVLASVGWHAESPPAGGTAREKWESLAALVSLADDVSAAHPDAGLADLVAELDQRADAQHAPTVQGVTLASLHSAKGLEWDAVFLVGLTDTTIPIQHATTEAQIAEERRLLYVGITRARQQLAISWALARSPGQRRGRRPSRFLDGLRPAGSSPVKAKKAAVAPAAEDAELFGRLRVWRKRQAEAQKVPAYVVFSDATLVAIADAAPAEPDRAGPGQRRRARPSSSATPNRSWPSSAVPTRRCSSPRPESEQSDSIRAGPAAFKSIARLCRARIASPTTAARTSRAPADRTGGDPDGDDQRHDAGRHHARSRSRHATYCPIGWHVDGTRLPVVDLAAARVQRPRQSPTSRPPLPPRRSKSAKPAPPPRGAPR